MINTKYIISTILILTLLVSAASAASLTVGSKATYKTIKSAVDAAHDGDTNGSSVKPRGDTNE